MGFFVCFWDFFVCFGGFSVFVWVFDCLGFLRGVGFWGFFLIPISVAELDTIFIVTRGSLEQRNVQNVAVEVSVFLGTVVVVSTFCVVSEIDRSWSQGIDNKWAIDCLYEVQGVWPLSLIALLTSFSTSIIFSGYLCFFIEQCIFWRSWFSVLYLKAQKKALACFFSLLFRPNWIFIIISWFFLVGLAGEVVECGSSPVPETECIGIYCSKTGEGGSS